MKISIIVAAIVAVFVSGGVVAAQEAESQKPGVSVGDWYRFVRTRVSKSEEGLEEEHLEIYGQFERVEEGLLVFGGVMTSATKRRYGDTVGNFPRFPKCHVITTRDGVILKVVERKNILTFRESSAFGVGLATQLAPELAKSGEVAKDVDKGPVKVGVDGGEVEYTFQIGVKMAKVEDALTIGYVTDARGYGARRMVEGRDPSAGPVGYAVSSRLVGVQMLSGPLTNEFVETGWEQFKSPFSAVEYEIHERIEPSSEEAFNKRAAGLIDELKAGFEGKESLAQLTLGFDKENWVWKAGRLFSCRDELEGLEAEWHQKYGGSLSLSDDNEIPTAKQCNPMVGPGYPIWVSEKSVSNSLDLQERLYSPTYVEPKLKYYYASPALSAKRLAEVAKAAIADGMGAIVVRREGYKVPSAGAETSPAVAEAIAWVFSKPREEWNATAGLALTDWFVQRCQGPMRFSRVVGPKDPGRSLVNLALQHSGACNCPKGGKEELSALLRFFAAPESRDTCWIPIPPNFAELGKTVGDAVKAIDAMGAPGS